MLNDISTMVMPYYNVVMALALLSMSISLVGVVSFARTCSTNEQIQCAANTPTRFVSNIQFLSSLTYYCVKSPLMMHGTNRHTSMSFTMTIVALMRESSSRLHQWVASQGTPSFYTMEALTFERLTISSLQHLHFLRFRMVSHTQCSTIQ